MKRVTKSTVTIFLVVSFVPLSHAMLTRVASSNVSNKNGRRLYSSMSQNCVKNHGIKPVIVPQTARGVLGDFKLDRDYGIRAILAQYIAYNENISLGSAKWESWQTTQKAYDGFLQHNSANAISKALDGNSIDTEYAIKALYFSQKVAWAFEDHLEYNKKFTASYSNDAEQYIYTDNSLYSKECLRLLQLLQKEQHCIETLVCFLQQSPKEELLAQEKKPVKRMKLEISIPTSRSSMVLASQQDSHSNLSPQRIAYVHDDALGKFSVGNHYSIGDYLQKIIDFKIKKRVNQSVTWKDIKEAYQGWFLGYNSPNHIKYAGSYGFIIEGAPKGNHFFNKEDVSGSLLFTQAVAYAMQHYLQLPDSVCQKLHGNADELTDGDVWLFSKLGIEPLTTPQGYNDLLLGNFADNRRCYTIYDYLRKYLARILQIPIEGVEAEAQLDDIKKVFKYFLQHNSPDVIYNAFDAGHIADINARDALKLTRCVTYALENYIAHLPEDACDVTVFELLWEVKKVHAQERNRRLEMPVKHGAE